MTWKCASSTQTCTEWKPHYLEEYKGPVINVIIKSYSPVHYSISLLHRALITSKMYHWGPQTPSPAGQGKTLEQLHQLHC